MLLLLLLPAVPACKGASPRPPALTWHDCGDDYECTTLQVPLDHTRPYGRQLTLAVTRLPAQGDRIGSLVLNPGGPGGSGVDYARAARAMLSTRLLDRFDIVGFDPRGVGRSTPIDCLDDAALDTFLSLDTTPDTADERTTLARASQAFATACRKRSGQLLPHLSTTAVAHDLDLLRAALGERTLTYLGKSYGTLLGAVYADLYPRRVRALVLDGGLDPTLPRLRLQHEQAEGFTTAFRAYARYCLAGRGCPFRSKTVDGVLTELTTFLRHTDKAPLPAARPVTETLATLGLLTPLYDRTSWPALTESLRQALAGDGTLLLHQADQLTGRSTDGAFSNQTEANLAVTCADAPHPPVSAYATAAPRAPSPFGASLIWSSLPCAYWPFEAKPLHPLRAAGAPPILVLGTTRDPATPYRWSQTLASDLTSATLLTHVGDGHTAYFNGSTCVDDLVDHYLTTALPPPPGTRCGGVE
ncbi:alpha/beta hydrolase [Nonomuraea sp. NPDC050310]|uniref:alpha/beta hydrolase n=1 Tax=Nonomuraea sp. NPDC050310 TaxID=3154935 RepID=UPI0033DA4EBD